MLSKKKRITKELFQKIMKNGGTLSGSLFTFRYMTSFTPQYAFVAPKAIVKKAPPRNKLRRQGYAALRSFPLKPCAGIFFYKKESKNATFAEIKADIAKIIQKIRV